MVTKNPQQTVRLEELGELEESLKAMQTRIQYLLKEESKNQKVIQKSLKESITKIGHKMAQVDFCQEMGRLNKQRSNYTNKMHGEIMELKQRQNRELSSVKESIKDMKRKESDCIKELSEKNQTVIQENRRKNLEKKKENIQTMRQMKEFSRQEIQKLKDERQSSLQKQKLEAISQKLKSKHSLQNKIEQLVVLERELRDRIKQSKQATIIIGQAASETAKVPVNEFLKIIKGVKHENKGADQEKIKEVILEKIMQKKLGGSALFDTQAPIQNTSVRSEPGPKEP